MWAWSQTNDAGGTLLKWKQTMQAIKLFDIEDLSSLLNWPTKNLSISTYISSF